MKKTLVSFALCLLILASVLSLSNCGGVVEFKVSFIVDGEVYSQIVTNGSEIIKMPDNPTKEGYKFDGWYWDEDTWQKPFTANSLLDAPLSSDMNVYAKWSENVPPCIHIDEDDDNKCDKCEESYSDGQDVHVHSYTEKTVNNEYLSSAPSCDSAAKYFYSCSCGEKGSSLFTHGEAKGHTWGDWCRTSAPSCTLAGMDERECSLCHDKENRIVSALGHTPKGAVEENRVEATCIADGHFDIVVYCSVCSGEVSREYNVIPKGHIFSNGLCDVCGVDDPSNFIITYMDGTIILKGLTPTTYVAGEGVALLPTYERDHYRFDGWYTDPSFADGTKVEVIASTASNDITLYAKFTYTQYSITYSLGGGVNSVNNPTSYNVGDETILENPTKEGHTFAGWYTDVYFKNQITSLEGYIGDLVLYAKWIQNSGSGILNPEHTFGE